MANGETVETVRDFILGGSKITANGDCSHEIKRRLTPWKKSYDQPRTHINKHCYVNKICLVKAMVFLVVIYGCESWTIKKTEHRRIDAFALLFWRRLLKQGDPTSPS